MKIVCPDKPNHNRFSVTAHVTEEWIVNETGEFQEVTGSSGEVLHRPDSQDYYVCIECNTQAKVTE